MATLTVQELPANGVVNAVTFTGADAGLSDEFTNDGNTELWVKNDDVDAANITLTVVKDSGALITETGTAIAVAASTIAVFWPKDLGLFSGTVTITTDDDTSLSYAVIKRATR